MTRSLRFLLGTWLAGATLAVAQPTYSGQVCLTGGTCTISVTADPTATAILVYPNPPGGGYFMTDDGSGNYSHQIAGLSPGTQLTFHLVIQIPQQYEFAPHTLTLVDGCLDFAYGDPDPDPNDPGPDPNEPDPDPDPDPDPPTLNNPRNFFEDVTLTGGQALARFETGSPASPLPATGAVDLHVRINGGPMLEINLPNIGGFVWSAPIPAAAGDVLDYFYRHTVGQQQVDTAWYRRVVGDPPTAGPDYPLVTTGAARFRDRHANEWRFDHYVQGYDVGRTFDFEITDWGTRLDVELTTLPEVPVGAVDIKWFDQAGPQNLCGRANSAISMRMDRNGTVFSATIPDLVPGQPVDIEFTLLAPQTYYSEFVHYRLGTGKLGQRWQDVHAYAAGDASISDVTIRQFSYNQHALNLSPAELRAFMEGKVLFETNFEDATLFNPPTAFDCNGGAVNFNGGASPVFKPGVLGPGYSNVSCIDCHMLDGRGRAPFDATDPFDDLTLQVSIPGTDAVGGPLPHPFYGRQLTHDATSPVVPEARPLLSYQTVAGQFDDGTPYTLHRPVIDFTQMKFGPLGTNIPGDPNTAGHDGPAAYSPRIAPALIGLGLLEAVPEAFVRLAEDPNDADGDGISGRANQVWSYENNRTELGRFGWKAGQPSLSQQSAAAFLHDMGITSPLLPTHDCAADPDCAAHADDSTPELDQQELTAIADYLRGLTVPPRHGYRSPQALLGKQMFEQANCQACHTPTLTTGGDYPIAGFRNQSIQPFTDLLLHDMGPDLADDRPEFAANGREWRTPPLWGIGLVGQVAGVPAEAFDPNGNPAPANYLHDGRARSLMEAILWHGGEADAARLAVLAMSAAERDALIRYVRDPFADAPYVVAGCGAGPAGDVNQDGTATTADVPALLACTTGPCATQDCLTPRFTEPACCNADTDADGDIDLHDWHTLMAQLSGE